MKPSDYNPPNEPEQFDAIHAFVCASVAACFSTIYPRANPEKFRELVARVPRPKAPARTEDAFSGCDCPCCEVAHARLRALSYERAYNSAAPLHCASTDRRNDIEDAVNARLLAIDKACLDEFNARLAADAAAAAAEKEFRSASEVGNAHSSLG